MAQATDTRTAPKFTGKADQKDVASRLYQLFQSQGRFFSEQAPIRLTREQLAEFMQQQGGDKAGKTDWTKQVDAALSANSSVFAREEHDGEVVFVTTRAGRPPSDDSVSIRAQTLTRRFTQPEPKREPARPRRKAHEFEPAIAEPELEIPTPAYEPDSWQAAVAESLRAAEEESARLAQLSPAELAEEEEEIEEAPAAVAEPAGMAAVDVAGASPEDVADAIRNSLSRELSVARWGDHWMLEDRVQRFSRGDLRRIEDFLREQAEPVPDTDIAQDILGVRPNSGDFDTTRFAVNYRLAHESREFEYLGVADAGVWALASRPSIGTTKRKASEIGQDYRYLLDYRTAPEPIEEGLVEHVLTFYEYAYGLLPLDANIGTIMPRPGFADQRAALITFESPQTHETVAAELRFPTSNRGGFIAGLDDFYAANLVPGAVLTIERTDEPTHFLLEYFQVSAEDRKLLHLDERKNRYAFRATTFYCATQAEMLLTESRFPKLADAKPLDERSKRRPEQVVAVTFERIGEQVGKKDAPRYHASFEDLLAASNVERPIGADLMRDILTSGTYQEFSADEGQEDAFFYQPATGS